MEKGNKVVLEQADIAERGSEEGVVWCTLEEAAVAKAIELRLLSALQVL